MTLIYLLSAASLLANVRRLSSIARWLVLAFSLIVIRAGRVLIEAIALACAEKRGGICREEWLDQCLETKAEGPPHDWTLRVFTPAEVQGSINPLTPQPGLSPRVRAELAEQYLWHLRSARFDGCTTAVYSDQIFLRGPTFGVLSKFGSSFKFKIYVFAQVFPGDERGRQLAKIRPFICRFYIGYGTIYSPYDYSSIDIAALSRRHLAELIAWEAECWGGETREYGNKGRLTSEAVDALGFSAKGMAREEAKQLRGACEIPPAAAPIARKRSAVRL